LTFLSLATMPLAVSLIRHMYSVYLMSEYSMQCYLLVRILFVHGLGHC